jgi:hypothetical protein
MPDDGHRDLRFLESSGNVRRALLAAIGREPNAEISRGVAITLQQGRMFFDAASAAPMEIRPLLLYYGMMAFSKAVISGRNLQPLASLRQSHGLRDVSQATARLQDLRVRIDAAGTFQAFNDHACELEGVTYHENSMLRHHRISTARSADITDLEVQLTCESPPGLQALYSDFREEVNKINFVTFHHRPICRASH